MSKLRALLSATPESGSPLGGLSDGTPRRPRRSRRRIRPVRVMSGSVGDLPILTLQDPADVQGEVIYDCRPSLLPVSLQLCDLGPMAGRQPEGSATVTVPPLVEGQVSEMDEIAFTELGVAPLLESGTDLEDELPMSDDSAVLLGGRSATAAVPEICPALQGRFDLELVKALLDVSVMPSMITPIDDPGASHPCRVGGRARVSVGGSSVSRCGVDSCSGVLSVAAPHGTDDQYLPRRDVPFGGESSDSASLPRPLTPRLLDEVMMVESTEDSTPGEPMTMCAPCGPDLSREGPFDEYHQSSESGTSPRVLDSLPGCPSWMTSHDEASSRPDVSPAYEIHLHDPRLLEYVSSSPQ